MTVPVPTIKDTLLAVAQAMSMPLTSEQADEAATAVETYIRQMVAAGVPAFEAELLAGGFVLGALRVTLPSSVRPS